MAKIGVNDIRSQCKENGWLLLSETYKNLDEPLEFKCDEGHFIMLPWKKVRNQWICPVCKNNKYKEIEHKTVKKKKDVKRVFALDQSSRITGYSIFDGTELIDYGFFKTELEDEIRRAHQLKE